MPRTQSATHSEQIFRAVIEYLNDKGEVWRTEILGPYAKPGTAKGVAASRWGRKQFKVQKAVTTWEDIDG